MFRTDQRQSSGDVTPTSALPLTDQAAKAASNPWHCSDVAFAVKVRREGADAPCAAIRPGQRGSKRRQISL